MFSKQNCFYFLGYKPDLSVVKSGQDASEMISKIEEIKKTAAAKDAEVREALAVLNAILELVGNLVHDSVPVSDDEVLDLSEFVYFQVI